VNVVANLVPGARLGKYELLKTLAVGGMAELYLARSRGDGGFEKIVVLKRILPSLALNEDFVKMFVDEARLAAQLHHPNIAAVYDIGHDAGGYFFAMEYVQGKDLREVMRASALTGGLPLEHALNIIVGVASGLHYAHEKLGPDGRALGIVHRDVSPANVIVTFDGALKLCDFGVAKARSRQTETRAGTLKGKIAYMSPEQCRGDEVDRRSDVYSLGILLYELTTGTRLYGGQHNEFKLLQQIANVDVPPPSTRIPGYPPELEMIVMRALSRDLDERYGAAEEMHVDLERFAARARLVLSSVELRRYMRELFPEAVPMRQHTAPSPVLPVGPPITVEIEADAPDDWDSFDEQAKTTEAPSPFDVMDDEEARRSPFIDMPWGRPGTTRNPLPRSLSPSMSLLAPPPTRAANVGAAFPPAPMKPLTS
jgi:serine/threonine protein kinase